MCLSTFCEGYGMNTEQIIMYLKKSIDASTTYDNSDNLPPSHRTIVNGNQLVQHLFILISLLETEHG